MKVKQYWIVVSTNATDLEEQVNKALKEDAWELRGEARAVDELWYQTLVLVQK